MGNRLGKSKVPLRRTRDIKSCRGSSLSNSKESILTATTINSRSLLLRDEVDEHEFLEEDCSSSEQLTSTHHHHGVSTSPPPYSSDEGTIIVNNGSDPEHSYSDQDLPTADLVRSDDRQRQQAFEEEILPNLAMPERILKKLTTEEWNELVHVFCLSLEQSVKSTLPQQPQPTSATSPVAEKKRHSSNHTSSHKYTLDETKKRSATANYCPVGSKKQKSHHHHSRKRRPLSLPPPDNPPTGGQERRKRRTGTLDTANQDEGMHHESHHRSRCHSNSHHCRRKNCSHNRAKFITLGQLKDLGLALNTKENDGSQSSDHHQSLRRSITSPHNLEQLCYLGPESINGRTDDEQDSSASNMAVADYDVSSTPVLPVPPPIPLTFKVKHLHKHSHFHVVHHTTDIMPDLSSGNRERHYHQSLVLAQGISQ